MQRWVMSVFSSLPVGPELLQSRGADPRSSTIILFWANQGCSIAFRLDGGGLSLEGAWQQPARNETQPHLILQLLKDCCQSAASRRAVSSARGGSVRRWNHQILWRRLRRGKECEVAYNRHLEWALLWGMPRHQERQTSLCQGLKSLQASWTGPPG